MSRTAKTATVMNLVALQTNEPKNPFTDEKSKTQKQSAFVSPALKLPTAVSDYRWDFRGSQMLNIITMLINDELGEILSRFNICSCEKCCQLITETVLSELPPVFVRVSKKSDEQQVNELLSKYRPIVMKALTKEAIFLRTKSLHTKKA